MNWHWRRRPRSRALVSPFLVSAVLLLTTTGGASAREQEGTAGHVYILNNNLGTTNSITIFDRAANGALTQSGVTNIGGQGSLAAFADGTQGSLIRTQNGRRLFAVDAGSNQISVLDVHDGELLLDGVFASGGEGPVSLTYRDDRLYVLNAANASAAAANVTGFRVDGHGNLDPIAGSTRPLSSAHPNPAQVQLDPSGEWLLVTEKGTNLIDVYAVARDGSLDGPTSLPSTGDTPFGMAFDPAARHELLVADAGAPPSFAGAVTAYHFANGDLTPIAGPVPDHQVAPCWMVITRDGHFAYTSDADSHTISGYRINTDGSIALLDPNGVTGSTPADTFPLEQGLSRNSRFLYVLDSRLLLATPGPATVSGFRIGSDGHLSQIVDPASITLPFSAIGLAAD